MGVLQKLDNTLGIMWKLALLVAIVAGLLYAGAIIYGNFFDKPDAITYQLPQFTENAKYRVTIASSGNTFYSNDCKREDTKVILTGYWEVSGKKYIYRNTVATMDERTFGQIIIQGR